MSSLENETAGVMFLFNEVFFPGGTTEGYAIVAATPTAEATERPDERSRLATSTETTTTAPEMSWFSATAGAVYLVGTGQSLSNGRQGAHNGRGRSVVSTVAEGRGGRRRETIATRVSESQRVWSRRCR